ncbi:MAG: hypothetical protein GU359_03400 [Desulfurococcales archaeon]|jgi:uncharacterized membrane protein|nr:ECF transporter S component [Desulfurococcales archaeon]MCC6062870.1 ECF transporter S component [Desulfurococcales archaeon]MCI4457344.1 ECF transporter S component [Desulfurococcaceae archaeon]NAZ13183.1 hypothetical protein [Desulfurococcales archaeon]
MREEIRLSVYTATVFVATVILQIYTPATRGYFNLGESAIYTIAYLSTPLITGLASGIGSALADLLTGYAIFAPGTLLIKFTEGYVVSYLMRRLSKVERLKLEAASIATAILAGFLISFTGIILWSGEVEISSVPINILGYQMILVSTSTSIEWWIWILIGVIVALIMIYMISVRGKRHLPIALSIGLGGLIMPTGYLLYEYFISNPLQGIAPQAAFFEYPINIGQMIAGLTISLSIISFIRRALE